MEFQEKLEFVIKSIDDLLSKEEIGDLELGQIDALYAAFKSEESDADTAPDAPAVKDEEGSEEAPEEAPAEESDAEEGSEEVKEEAAKSEFSWPTGDFNDSIGA